MNVFKNKIASLMKIDLDALFKEVTIPNKKPS